MVDVLDILADPDVRAAFERAGWTPSRRHGSAQAWTDQLVYEGFSVVPGAADLLTAFGDLEVVPPPAPRDLDRRSGPIHFNPVWAAIDQSGLIDKLAIALGTPLTPVAEWDEEIDQRSVREQRTWLLLLAGDGRVVAATRSEAVLVGPDLRSAFSNLILADAPLTTLIGAEGE